MLYSNVGRIFESSHYYLIETKARVKIAQEDSDTDEDDNGPSDVDDDGLGTKSGAHVECPQDKRKFTSNIPGSSKRIKRGAAQSQALVAKQSELQEVDLLVKSYPVGPSFREDNEAGGHDGMNVTLSEKAGDELGRRLIECEVKRKEALAECHLEAEKKREEVRTKLETMLSRHRLKRAGYSEKDVNDVLPL
ncbi:hypothetical protein PRIC1_000229 [Phytophthora ramorum]|nr:hypothetical protein KRP22_12006 [Phytophthora ramorum]